MAIHSSIQSVFIQYSESEGVIAIILMESIRYS